LAIYKPVQFNYLTWVCGGYHFARILHFALTVGYVMFFVIHIVQVILAGWNNFRSVISGFEVVDETPQLAFEGALLITETPGDSIGTTAAKDPIQSNIDKKNEDGTEN